MEYTGNKVDWHHAYGNYSANIHGFWLHINYDASNYIVMFENHKLVKRFTNVDEAITAGIRLAVKTLSTALTELE